MNGPVNQNQRDIFVANYQITQLQVNQVVKVLFQVHLKIIHLALNLTVTFTDPDLNFTVAHPNRNPIELYPRLGPPNSISPSHGPSSAHVATPCACSPLDPPHPNQVSLSGFIEDLIW